MPNKNPTSEEHAIAFFTLAREYQRAAKLCESGLGGWSNPTKFLYSHTVELTLKAFIRSHNLPIRGTKRMTHVLKALYDECASLKQKLSPYDENDIDIVVTLLDSGNEQNGYRYFNPNTGVTADPAWTREVVEKLMQAVEPFVADRVKQEPPIESRSLNLTMGKPVR